MFSTQALGLTACLLLGIASAVPRPTPANPGADASFHLLKEGREVVERAVEDDKGKPTATETFTHTITDYNGNPGSTFTYTLTQYETMTPQVNTTTYSIPTGTETITKTVTDYNGNPGPTFTYTLTEYSEKVSTITEKPTTVTKTLTDYNGNPESTFTITY